MEDRTQKAFFPPRFVDLRHLKTEARFAFYEPEELGGFYEMCGIQTWVTWSDFEDDFFEELGDGFEDCLETYRAVTPSWAFEEPDD